MMGNVILWIFVALYAFWVLSTVLVVLLENRQPVKTIAWVLVLIMLPGVGLLFFYAFGEDMRKERRIERKSLAALTLRSRELQRNTESNTAARTSGVAPRYGRLISLLEEHNMAFLTGHNRVDVHSDGTSFILSLLSAIGKARHHIHLQTYIIDDDALGRLLADMLMDKAREGVEVRLLYDDVGCWNVHDRFFRRMARAGVKVCPFMPVKAPMFTHKINYRNHRKVAVIDGRIGFIGGMNIARRYVRGTEGHRWRDLHLQVEGGSVSALQRCFLTDWSLATGVLISDPSYTPRLERRAGQAAVQIVMADPVSHWPQIMSGITWMILNARRYIYIQTPYFMPTEPVLQALRTAAMSGVDVRLMVPQKPDGFWLRWANDSYFSDVLEAGVRLFTYRPGFLHSKALVADDEWATVGSSNMDFRSFENNMEANAFIYDRPTALRIRQIFETDSRGCKEIRLSQWNRRSYRRRLLESFTRIFSPLL